MSTIYEIIFCKKCGYMDHSIHWSKPAECSYCHYNCIITVPNKEYNIVFEEFRKKFNNQLSDEMYLSVEEYFRERYIYHDNPDFDRSEYEKMLLYRQKELKEELEYFLDCML